MVKSKQGNLTWKSGLFELEETSCQAKYGMLIVPENRAQAGSRSIQLPVVRLPATGENPREPVFLLAGGPGNSNIWKAPPTWLLEQHDVVMVGYRGADGSETLACPEVTAAVTAQENPLSSENLQRLGQALYATFQRLTREGVDIDGYTVIEVIDDLEAVREGLGYKQINLYGLSFGTRIAYLYGLRYPASIHRSLMVGVSPPGGCVWEPSITDALLRRYAGLWKADPACTARSPDLIQSIGNVLDTLPKNWHQCRIDADKVRIMTFIFLSNRHSAAMVLDAFVAAEQGDVSGLVYLSAAYDRNLATRRHWGDLASKAVSADYDPDRDYEAEMDPPESIIGAPASKLYWGCLRYGGWPIQPIPEEYRQLQHSAVPTLMVNGNVDFSTPVENAQKLLPYLRNGKLVVPEVMGHCSDVVGLQPEAFRLLAEAFYLDGIVDNRFATMPMNFTPSPTLQELAKEHQENT